jgi:hypothetical protein
MKGQNKPYVLIIIKRVNTVFQMKGQPRKRRLVFRARGLYRMSRLIFLWITEFFNRRTRVKYFAFKYHPVCQECGSLAEYTCEHGGGGSFCLANHCDHCLNNSSPCTCPKPFDPQPHDEARIQAAEDAKPRGLPLLQLQGKIDRGDRATCTQRCAKVEACPVCNNGARIAVCRGNGQRGEHDVEPGAPRWRCGLWACSNPTCATGGDVVMHRFGKLRCTCPAIGDTIVIHGLVNSPLLNRRSGTIVLPPNEDSEFGRSPDRYSSP